MLEHKCKECNSMSFEYIERLGEQICSDCGLVLSVNPIAETVQYTTNSNVTSMLGSFVSKKDIVDSKSYALRREHLRVNPESEADRQMRVLCNMILSNYNVTKEIKLLTQSYYKTIKRERIFRGVKVEWRAAALTYYVLKENNIITSLKKHELISKVPKSDISRQAKKVAKFRRNATVFTQRDSIQLANTLLDRLQITSPELRLGIIKLVEYVSRNIEQRDMRFTDNMLGACFYMASVMLEIKITQGQIAKSWPCSTVGIRISTTQLSDIFNFDKTKLRDYDLDAFIMGVRYE